MKIDYGELELINEKLRILFGNINSNMDNINYYTSNISNNWDSDTKEYFFNLYSTLNKNFDIVKDRFTNTLEFLDSVVSNYKTIDNGGKL